MTMYKILSNLPNTSDVIIRIRGWFPSIMPVLSTWYYLSALSIWFSSFSFPLLIFMLDCSTVDIVNEIICRYSSPIVIFEADYKSLSAFSLSIAMYQVRNQVITFHVLMQVSLGWLISIFLGLASLTWEQTAFDVGSDNLLNFLFKLSYFSMWWLKSMT